MTELLVVLGIIAVLVALLFPSIEKAYQTSLGIKCLNNERQLFQATTAYAADHDGSLPGASSSGASYSPQAAYVDLSAYVTLSRLRCPLYPQRKAAAYQALASTNIYSCTYAYNSAAWYYNWRPNHIPKMTMIPHPSLTGMWVDAGWVGTQVVIWERAYSGGGDFGGSGRYPIPPNWHNGGLNVVFFDGHAATISQQQLVTVDDNPATPQSPFGEYVLGASD